MSLVALYEAACDSSLLWRTVLGVSRTSSQAEGGDVAPHPVGKAAGVLFCGVLFGLLSLGKPTVLAAFLVIGVLVVRRLVSLSSQVLRRALPLLGAVVLVAASLHAAILLSEHFRYGGLHSEVRKEMAEAMRRADFVPDERGVVEHSSVNLRGRGVPFRDVLMRSEPPFLRTTLASFAGSYGALSYPNPFPWYVAVGLCWTALLACGAVRLIRSRPAAVDILSALALLAVPALLLGASAWHSWTADYQPQGRYLFPSNIAWAAIGALIPSAQKGGGRAARLATCVLIALLLLGLYSFLCYGILPMTRA